MRSALSAVASVSAIMLLTVAATLALSPKEWTGLTGWADQDPRLFAAILIAVIVYGFVGWLLVGFKPGVADWLAWMLVPPLGLLMAWLSVRYLVQLGWDWSKRDMIGKMVLLLGGPVLLLAVTRYLHLLSIGLAEVRDRLLTLSHRTPHLPPLPSQDAVATKLSECTGTARSGHFPLAASVTSLRAFWGSGKTACMNAFTDRVTREGGGVVVWFDCWRHQADPQPEFRLFCEVSSDWRVMWPFGWLVMPALRTYLTMLPVVASASLDFGKFKLTADSSKIETPKALFWQRHLRALASVARLGRGRVVIIMEDIDRCTPLAAQRYVTLIRRFLAVPNVSVVVPHVEQQFRPKVFHPLAPQLPDLAATTEAVLWDWFGPTMRLPPDATDEEKPESPLDQALEPSDKDANNREAHSTDYLARLRPHLIRQFAHQPAQYQERIFALMEEKYLSDQVVPIPDLDARDLATMVVNELRRRRDWCEIIEIRHVQAPWQHLSEAVETHMKRFLAGQRLGTARATPRQFSGAFTQVLNDIGNRLEALVSPVWTEGSKREAAGMLAVLLVRMAYDLAVTRTAKANPQFGSAAHG